MAAPSGKLTPDDRRTLRAALLGLKASYERGRTKYVKEGREEFCVMIDKELGRVARVLSLVEEL